MIEASKLTQMDISNLLGVSATTIFSWQKTDYGDFPGPFPLPKKSGRYKFYDWKAVLTWYIRYRISLDYKDVIQPVREDDVDFNLWKARKMKADAQHSETELQVAQGLLVPLEEIEKSWTATTIKVRSKMMQLPSRLSTLIHDGQTPAERDDVIDSEMRTILSELSEVV